MFYSYVQNISAERSTKHVNTVSHAYYKSVARTFQKHISLSIYQCFRKCSCYMFKTFGLNIRSNHYSNISHSYYKSVVRTFQKNISLYFSWNIYEVFRKCSIHMFRTFQLNVRLKHVNTISHAYYKSVAKTFQKNI